MAAYEAYEAKIKSERMAKDAERELVASQESSANDRGGSKRDRDGGAVDDKQSKKKSKHDDLDREKSRESHKEKEKDKEKSWLRNGIRVKIISRKFGDNYYLMKSCVLDVYGHGLASVRLDDGKVLENVKEKYLETVLPTIGGSCIVLRGGCVGQIATLLERKKETEQVVVQMLDDLDIHVLSADDVAATS